MEKCRGEKIAPQHKNAWFGFIKSVATFKGDLSALTAPPFLLSPQSIVEFPTYWAEHPSLFVAPTHSSSPEERSLLVLKWFISTLKWQHSTRDENGKKRGMKPLNPFLGECFMGEWGDDEDSSEHGVGKTRLVAEQVSHHPPATSYNIWNEKHGVQLQGTIAPKSYFSTTVHIERHGYSLLTLSKHNETYLITMPPIHLTGFMSGSISPELSGTSYIRSSAGFTTKIVYSSRGWISGRVNGFEATISQDGDGMNSGGERIDTPIYKATGQWSSSFTINDLRTGENIVHFDTSSSSNLRLRRQIQVQPIDRQEEYESRRAWRGVMDGIRENDFLKLAREKARIEDEQRGMRRREREEGREWVRRFFVKGEGVRSEVVGGLVRGLEMGMGKGELVRGLGLGLVGGAGVWEWSWERYREFLKREEEGEGESENESEIKWVVGSKIDEMDDVDDRKNPLITSWNSGVVVEGVRV